MGWRVLGAVEFVADGAAVALGGAKQRTAVAVLVAGAGRLVTVDTLLQAIYGEDASPTSRASLHTYVSNLRGVVGDVIVRHGDGYRLDCTNATIDAAVFEAAYRSVAGVKDAEDVASRLREALAMWRGHPYADVEAHGVLDGEIARLAELRLSALEARIDADMRAGRHREVVAELDALTVEHPYREHLRAMHMLALYRSGRQAEALRAFGRTREMLIESLGIDPSPELRELQRRILAQDRDLLISVGPTVLRRAVLVADIDDTGWNDPLERELAFARREAQLASAAERDAGVKLAPKGTAGYAVFVEPIHAVRAARAIVGDRTRVAVDVGDVELGDHDPVGPPLSRAARLVAVAHPGQVLLSAAAHDALASNGEGGWAAESLGRFDIVGLDPGAHVYQLVGNGFVEGFPPLRTDRLPPAMPAGPERWVPGYELRAAIGGGQLGEVHRAYQPTVGREVAVRIFGSGMVGHPQFVRRFETALQRVTRVEHPHVVPLLDYWREPDRAVTVSRLMTGGDLGQRIPGDGMNAADALAIFEAVAAGVASAHRHGLVHGRIRPENVLFDDEGNAYVADLGVDEICAGVVTFATGAYDAPERLGGALATPLADVYSLGVLVHHLLGGSPPPLDGPLPLGEDPVDLVVSRATDPDPAGRHGSVAELLAALRAALAAPTDSAAAFVPTRNPYRGLEAFEQADAEDFYGRDDAIAEMVAILEHERLLLVVGPSGIGKSSVVKAGLVPALGRGRVAGSESWLVTDMTPGRDPFAQLAASLERVANVAPPDVVGQLMAAPNALDEVVRRVVPGDTGVLVVIDQLEELFTQTVDERERRAFLQMMVALADRPSAAVRIVATLRADYFDRPLGHPGLGDALRGRTIALGAMTAAELADAVRLPSAGLDVDVTSALVERIAAEAELQPGALPLVQHTMAELFEERQTNTITLDQYERVGGLAGSVGRRAEAIYASIDGPARQAARQMLLRLVTVSEDHDDSRRRVRRTELDQSGVAADDLDVVLAEYGSHRLLTFDRDPVSRTPTVELAHEALLTEWARYRGWIDEARVDLLTRRRLESATHDWTSSGSDPSFLYGGGRLELAESWAANSGFALTDDERRFLATSRTKVDRDQVVRTRRRSIVVGVLAAALVVAIVGAAVALVQRSSADRQAAIADEQQQEAQRQAALAEEQQREAQRQAALAEEQQQEAQRQAAIADEQRQTAEREADRADRVATLAEARRVSTQALATEDHDQALLLAVEGRHLDDSAETRSNLLEAIQRSPDAIAVIRSDTEAFLDLGLTPDGTTLLASGVGGPSTLSSYDATTRALRGSIATDETRVSSAVSPDGRVAVMSSTEGGSGTLTLVDTATLAAVGDPLQTLDVEWPTRLSFSPDGRYVAAVTDQPLSGAGASVPIAYVWDVARGGAPIVRYEFAAENFRRDVAFLPDSTQVVVAGTDGTAVLDIASGQPVGQIAGAYAPLAVSPDGTTLAAATDASSGVVIGLFDLTTGDRSAVLAGHRERLIRLAFSPDGSTLASGADDRLVITWDVASGQRLGVFEGHGAGVNALAFSADGKTLWSAGDDRAIFAWDLQRAATLVHEASPAVTAGRPLPGNSVDMIIGPDGRYVAYPAADLTSFQVRDVSTGDLGPPSAVEHGEFKSFSPDGTRYVTIDLTGALRVWETATGAAVADSAGSGRLFSSFPAGAKAVFSPDGRHVLALEANTTDPNAVGFVPETLVVLDATTLAPDGDPVRLGYAGRTISVAPDGRQAVVVANTPGQGETKVLLVDLETRRIVRASAPMAEFDERSNGPRNNTVAPDGRTVGIGGTKGDVVVVDAVTGEVSPVLPAHDGFVESVTFAPDAATFITTGQDGAVKLWDRATWRLLYTLLPLGPNHRIRASYLRPDRVMIVDDTGVILEWDPRPDAWEQHACNVAGRNLTHAEWAESFPGQAYRVTCPAFPADE